MKNVLVIGAHPDDEIIGLGGTLRRHVEAGDSVFAHLLTDGHSSRESDADSAMEKRNSAAEKSAGVIGFQDITFDSFADQMLDTESILKVVQSIENVAKKVKPDVVYFHHRGDANVDHQVVFKACVTAFRSTGANFPSEMYCYETLSSTEWGAPFPESAFVPNYFVDISKTLETKLKAMKCYDDELRDYPHPRSEMGIQQAAQRWGKIIGCDAAEAFVIFRKIWKQ